MSSPTVRLRDVAPQPRYMTYWERIKHTKVHLLPELFAEMLGVFFYVYAGVGSTAAYTVGNLTSQPVGSLFTVGAAYCIGIVLAVTVCAATSGGHFNPGLTISSVIFGAFPIWKAALYIVAQILGSYIACLVVYVQWKDLLKVAEGVLIEKGVYDILMFTPEGPGGIFGFYVLPGTNLIRVLLNEFVTDLMIGFAISACLDPTNHLIPPAAAPWVVGFTYGMAVWGFAPTVLAANTARDLGGRLMAMTIWGRQAVGGPYGAISALTNIPATVLAFFLHSTLLSSPSRTLTPQHFAFLKAQNTYRENNGLVPVSHPSIFEPDRNPTSESFDDKVGNTTRTMVGDARSV